MIHLTGLRGDLFTAFLRSTSSPTEHTPLDSGVHERNAEAIRDSFDCLVRFRKRGRKPLGRSVDGGRLEGEPPRSVLCKFNISLVNHGVVIAAEEA